MVVTNRFIGGVLLVAGTSIGAGMLALPVFSGFMGFFPSMLFLGLCWLFMFTTAMLLLDVNLSIEGEPNLITMAEKTLGGFGKAFCWLVYLFLLYSLTAAYIAACAPLFAKGAEVLLKTSVPNSFGPFPMLLFFGIVIYSGTKAVDYLNRFLMAGLVLSYLTAVFFIPSHVQIDLLKHIDLRASLLAVPLMITSFGFHIIIPTLTTYMRHSVNRLRWMIFVGSIIPLGVYILWELLALGVLNISGEFGLVEAYRQGKNASWQLVRVIENPTLSLTISFFTFFAVITSFLGVSTSLSDFLRDGFKIKKTSGGKALACLLTFTPPLIFVLFYPQGFLMALQYAGIFVALLLGVLPALMAWNLNRRFFRRCLLVTVLLVSIFIIVLVILQEMGSLRHLVQSYLGVCHVRTSF